MRRTIKHAATCCAAGLALALAAPAGAAPLDPNPCLTVFAKGLRCPDIVMDRPWGMYLDSSSWPGHALLRAGNAIESIGKGPVELRGVRASRLYMNARQRIYKRRGGWITVRTGARLRYKFAHLQRYWWKFFRAASFQLWRLDAHGERVKRVKTGPKVSYCLRDLDHTRSWLGGSPFGAHYPACSNTASLKYDTLGTSVGWADVYPPDYPEQWIEVTGLRGCFAYVHTADPANGVYESNERDNRSQVIVRLPYNSANRKGGCPGRDRGPIYRSGGSGY
ncbi:MAG TPA: lysyl oxidase family protein [Thermoleophilaceae bacterium]|nr:lysyl oxidase family protein [Thermoleophilaceae bacterium]